MSTKHTSIELISPNIRRQARPCEAVILPKRPEFLEPKIELEEPYLRQTPEASPRKRTFLFSAEWAWSPINNRLNNYYLNSNRTSLLLWNNYVEDGFVNWTWHWELLAYAKHCQSDEKTVATHLILEFWKYEAERHLLEHYDRINNLGLLSVEQVQAIAREVWKDE